MAKGLVEEGNETRRFHYMYFFFQRVFKSKKIESMTANMEAKIKSSPYLKEKQYYNKRIVLIEL